MARLVRNQFDHRIASLGEVPPPRADRDPGPAREAAASGGQDEQSLDHAGSRLHAGDRHHVGADLVVDLDDAVGELLRSVVELDDERPRLSGVLGPGTTMRTIRIDGPRPGGLHQQRSHPRCIDRVGCVRTVPEEPSAPDQQMPATDRATGQHGTTFGIDHERCPPLVDPQHPTPAELDRPVRERLDARKRGLRPVVQQDCTVAFDDRSTGLRRRETAIRHHQHRPPRFEEAVNDVGPRSYGPCVTTGQQEDWRSKGPVWTDFPSCGRPARRLVLPVKLTIHVEGELLGDVGDGVTGAGAVVCKAARSSGSSIGSASPPVIFTSTKVTSSSWTACPRKASSVRRASLISAAVRVACDRMNDSRRTIP